MKPTKPVTPVEQKPESVVAPVSKPVVIPDSQKIDLSKIGAPREHRTDEEIVMQKIDLSQIDKMAHDPMTPRIKRIRRNFVDVKTVSAEIDALVATIDRDKQPGT